VEFEDKIGKRTPNSCPPTDEGPFGGIQLSGGVPNFFLSF